MLLLWGQVAENVHGRAEMLTPAFTIGLSKAAAHYLVRKLHFENQWLIAYPIELG